MMLINLFKFKRTNDKGDFCRTAESEIDRPGFSAGPGRDMKFRSGFDRDMRNGGWKLLENINDPVEFDISRLELVSFLQTGETDTRGETMVKRARGKEPVNGQKLVGCNWGQRHGETLLRNQRLIPMECRGKVIVLTGTIWRDDSGKRNVPCLIFDGEQWVLLFYWLDGSFSSFFQLFRLRELSAAP